MHRTIQTALHSFPQLENKIPWLAIESIREQTGLHPCDKRKTISEHKLNYKSVVFDFVVQDADPLYDRYILREPDEHVARRCSEFLVWLGARPEREIIVVTHSAYLRHLFNRVLDSDSAHDKREYRNCEMRSYVLRLSGPEAELLEVGSEESDATLPNH